MPIVFAGAASHAPGMTAWPDAVPADQKDRLYAAYDELRRRLEAARVERLIVLTSEHWTNFFLDHIGAFCVGRAQTYEGPVEPWLKVEKRSVPGDPEMAEAIVEAAYANDVEPSFAYELHFDHGTMLPLHFLTPRMDVPVVPVYFNTLAAPQPAASRCMEFGRIIGEVARRSHHRVGIVATGGLSHDPGERAHGTIDAAFDRRFLDQMAHGDLAALAAYRRSDFVAAGAGAFEVLTWIALRGALAEAHGDILAYEAVVPWATGMGMIGFSGVA